MRIERQEKAKQHLYDAVKSLRQARDVIGRETPRRLAAGGKLIRLSCQLIETISQLDRRSL